MTNPNCDYCQDQGIVELTGYSKDGYSRGSAPCKWCDRGIALRDQLTAKKQHPLTDYSIHTLAATPQPGYHAVTKAEALAEWAACEHRWVDDGPPQARRWAGDSIQWKTCRSCGKQEIDHLPLEAHHSNRRAP